MKILWKNSMNWDWVPPSAHLLLICDDLFKNSPFIKKVPAHISIYFVKAGEGLKDLQHWHYHLLKIQKSIGHHKISGVIAMGGGSVGDFAGFFASVYKRGVDFYQCPTTWLAAIDSAHGGKTALNLGKYKNQVGSFKQAKITFVCKEILSKQPSSLLVDGLSELFKMALIEGGSLWVSTNKVAQFLLQEVPKAKESPSALTDLTWNLLKPAVASKYRIVNKDPLEKKGLRQILNLGHTMGHVFELHCDLSHGAAVNYGLAFAIEFSFHKKLLKEIDYNRISNSPVGLLLRNPHDDGLWKKLSLSKVKQILLTDKKRSPSSSELHFIFLTGIGKTKRLSVPVEEILEEIRKQIRFSAQRSLQKKIL